MNNKKLIILIILALAGVFSLIYGIVSPPRRRQEASSEQEVVRQDEKVQLVGRGISTKRRAEKTDYISWGKNPFSPKGTSVSSSGLTGIIWDEESPKALIGDAVVGIGDKIGGNTIIDIKQDRVILTDGTKEFELRLER